MRDVCGDRLLGLVFKVAGVDGMFAIELEGTLGAPLIGAASRKAALVTKAARAIDVELLCTLAIVFVGFSDDCRGVSTPFTAPINEALPFMPEGELAVGVYFSLVPSVPEVPASRLAAITFRTEEASGIPDAGGANVGMRTR